MAATGNQHPSRFLLASPHQGPPSNHTKSSNSDANLDGNMIIILAALLCALVCVLGLNTFVRCAMRCTWRFTAGEAAGGRRSSGGLKRSILRRIPVLVFGGTGTQMSGTECPICLTEFCEGDKVRLLPWCNHGYHVTCIDTWLASHSSCPTCRQSLLEPFPETFDGGAGTEAGMRQPAASHDGADATPVPVAEEIV